MVGFQIRDNAFFTCPATGGGSGKGPPGRAPVFKLGGGEMGRGEARAEAGGKSPRDSDEGDARGQGTLSGRRVRLGSRS